MLFCFELKFPESEKEFKRAIQLNPNYATAHHWFGNSVLTSLGRFDEAVKRRNARRRADPLSLIINADLGGDLMLARRFDDAIRAAAPDPCLGRQFCLRPLESRRSALPQGDVTGAITEYEKAKALDDDPEILGLLARAYAENRQKEQALEILRKLKETAQHQYVRRYIFALVYIGLRPQGDGHSIFGKCFLSDNENVDTTWIRESTHSSIPLRNDARFQQLVARMFPRNAQRISGNFFTELSRRNVIRMAGLYLVGAWFTHSGG